MGRFLIICLLLAGLVTALRATRNALDATEERREYLRENPLRDLPAREVISDYVGTLMLGGFRSLAVDVMYMHEQKLKEQEEYDEQLVTDEMIVRLQPHMVKVWDFMGYNMAYNIGWELEDPKQRWEWVERGLRLLDEGQRRNPRSPLLTKETAWIYYHRIPQEDYLRQRVRETMKDPERPGGPTDCYTLASHWFRKTQQLEIDEAARAGKRMDHIVNYEGLAIDSLYSRGLIDFGLAAAAAREGQLDKAKSLLDQGEESLLAASDRAKEVSAWASDPTFWRNRAAQYRGLVRSRTVLMPSLLDAERRWIDLLAKSPSSREALWPQEVFSCAQVAIRRSKDLLTEPIQRHVLQVVLDSLSEAFTLWDRGKIEEAKRVFAERAAFASSFAGERGGWNAFAHGVVSLQHALAKEKEAAGAADLSVRALALEEARRTYRMFIERDLWFNVDPIRQRLERLGAR